MHLITVMHVHHIDTDYHVHHIDTDYYDRFLGPGAYGPAHTAAWHR